MTTSIREYKQLINARAQTLRKKQTPAEAKLWPYLRGRKFAEIKFRRQKPVLFHINNQIYFFIADFYCHEYKLIIEIDGSIHNDSEQHEYDVTRAETLTDMGYKVLRFKNKEVMENIEEVLEKIKTKIDELS
ncbi:MAG: endonuclease domain-containing protein [Patescibacteria group bacterium]